MLNTILLTTLNNVGSTTLFKAVFNNPEQVVHFYACSALASIRLSEVQKKAGAKHVYNGIVKGNLGRHFLFCSR